MTDGKLGIALELRDRYRGTMLRNLLKSAIARTPYRIIRNQGSNRFSAFRECLASLKKQGYCPSVVIDGGANAGMFSLEAAEYFPRARFHLIEPQPPCLPQLRHLCATKGFTLHELALSDRDGTVSLLKTDTPSTGAYVNPAFRNEPGIDVPACTLDTLFYSKLQEEDQAFLKLDLQGHDLNALRGGTQVLRVIDTVLVEVSFDKFGDQFDDVVCFMRDYGFRVDDFAALCGSIEDHKLLGGDVIFRRRLSC